MPDELNSKKTKKDGGEVQKFKKSKEKKMNKTAYRLQK